MLERADPEGEDRDDLSEICKAGRRAADLTRQLLLFSRQHAMEPKVTDVRATLTEMERLVRRVVGEDVTVVMRTEREVGRVCVGPTSIEQVVMNLVANATDAMPEGGILTIETADVELGDDYVVAHMGVAPGPHVMISVTDTGVGMDKATQARIFEPFFTTKGVGKGTGLGLSMVFGIVRQNGGTVWVYSEPGQGTTFKVYLPRVDAAVDAAEPGPASSAMKGTESILLVEDEEQVRIVARSILQRAGYRVVDASSGDEALELARSEPGVFHLLVSDVVMPQMSGPELAKHLATSRPEMKVLFMSGYTDDSVVRHGLIDAHAAFMQKPITAAALTRKVRDVLDARRPG